MARAINTQPLNQLRLRFAFGLLSMNFFTAPASSAMEPNTMKVAVTNSAPRTGLVDTLHVLLLLPQMDHRLAHGQGELPAFLFHRQHAAVAVEGAEAGTVALAQAADVQFHDAGTDLKALVREVKQVRRPAALQYKERNRACRNQRRHSHNQEYCLHANARAQPANHAKARPCAVCRTLSEHEQVVGTGGKRHHEGCYKEIKH